MTTLRLILDDAIDPIAGTSRYAEELARALVATRPSGAEVAGIVSSIGEEERAGLAERVPGLAALHVSALSHRQLVAAWQHGFTPLPGHGIVHATSLLAPLRRHDVATEPESQVAVTIHDAIAWTDPELLPSRAASWARAMGRRAERYADGIVVPTHAVAEELARHLDLGDRVRVIGGAAGSRLRPVGDAVARRTALGLPEGYVLVVATGEPRKGLEALMDAVGMLGGTPLVIAGAAAERDMLLARAAGSAAPVTVLERLADDDLAAVYQGAAVYVQPSIAEGFCHAMVEAFAFGLPVVHSDAPSLTEVAAGAGIEVSRDDAAGYPGRLADAIRGLLDDPATAARLGLAASDRAKAFTWRDAAEKVWQLHADL